ncbi:MAG: phosphoenolpyruvate synthase [Gammaproteobacteria bacterium]
MPTHEPIIWLNQVSLTDIDSVGGKNASLGEMIQNLSSVGVKVPTGFATTAQAYREFLDQNGLTDKINALLDKLDVDNVDQLQSAGKTIREWIMAQPLSAELMSAVEQAYQRLTKELGQKFSVAVRSSATAEDLPDASFAGQQETFLNVQGLNNILIAIKKVFASLFTDRAIAYRVHQGYPHEKIALSAGIQQMVRSDCGASGVMFTLDTESGFDQVVFVNASYGLGETVVQGSVNPDEYYVYKPALQAKKPALLRKTLGAKHQKMIYAEAGSNERVKIVPVDTVLQNEFCLTHDEVEQLGRYALLIENHYKRPMDIEWAKDGNTGQLYILQARPETVNSQKGQSVERYQLNGKGKVLVTGRAIGQRIGSGIVRCVKSVDEMNQVQEGDVLVADMTDPDWEPVMKKAAAIVTNRGGRTCHAAIIARELGIPAIVGTNHATQILKTGDAVTVSCAEGETGNVYAGQIPFKIEKHSVNSMPKLPIKIMVNVGNPDRAFDFQRLPNHGVGLARLEFIINRMIGVHPKALLNFNDQTAEVKAKIKQAMAGYSDPVNFYVQKLIEGISTLAAAFAPKPVIVRLSDFKSNEYAHLIGGARYEPTEENPMIGFRGASRYISDSFKDCFALEAQALKYVRDEMGLTNIEIMVPFVRTPLEGKTVVELLAKHGLARGKNGLRLIMMCEIPSNALLAEDFLQHFDGFSIGSNDLTQMTLGLDRDSGLVAATFDERNGAVKALIHRAIHTCRNENKYIGICGQGPSDYPDFAQWLIEEGIDSISLNPDTVIDTWLYLAKHNAKNLESA